MGFGGGLIPFSQIHILSLAIILFAKYRMLGNHLHVNVCLLPYFSKQEVSWLVCIVGSLKKIVHLQIVRK